MEFGTEEQKRRFLPPIVRGDVLWCQGYSETGAGSDLASLSCKAVREGDEYLINGSKIWTSDAHLSDWLFGLFRTDSSDKKQRGSMKTGNLTKSTPSQFVAKQTCQELMSVNVKDCRTPVVVLRGADGGAPG